MPSRFINSLGIALWLNIWKKVLIDIYGTWLNSAKIAITSPYFTNMVKLQFQYKKQNLSKNILAVKIGKTDEQNHFLTMNYANYCIDEST